MTEWHYQIMGREYGPVNSDKLQELAFANDINRDTFVRQDDGDWITADRVIGLFDRSQAGVQLAVESHSLPE